MKPHSLKHLHYDTLHYGILLFVRLLFATLLFATLLMTSTPLMASEQCSYSTYKWNVNQRKAVAHERISKPRSALTDAERDPATGCTVCEEDQVELQLSGLRPFRVCHLLAERFRQVLTALQAQQAPLQDIVGYRVGQTRGDIDAAGNRTGFSNHSFGIALDINTDQNGLYDNCYSYGPQCRLIKGGKWDPKQSTSLTADSVIVQMFKKHGFRWGGEIAGKQKDFMHISPTGY